MAMYLDSQYWRTIISCRIGNHRNSLIEVPINTTEKKQNAAFEMQFK